MAAQRDPLRPGPFAPEAIEPETAALNAAIERVLAQTTPIHHQRPAEIRAARERGEGVWGPVVTVPQAKTRTIPGPAGAVPVRVIAPDAPRGVYLHLHGGGWTLGAPHHTDVPNLRLAEACGLVVVSVDYRLAPEHPYPAGPDDCEAAALWLAEHARREFGCDWLAIGGESAGAHLAVVTLLRLRDRHGFQGVRAANLLFGAYDLSLTPSVRRWGERNLILSTPIIEWFTDHFVGPELRRHPDVSPLYADLAGLPPALLTVGTLDPLLDDSLFLAARWQAAGNRAELDVWPGGVHGFHAFPIPIAERSNRRIVEFLSGALGGSC
ncbi:MAG: alpha/beta hydrolase [Deltaproteobacteria bacterium]|nr:alpha/beta hydrolase [Deltaproteobacteria bacterium]